ncbi:MAG: hypothetical protein OEV94_08405 [Deltaproteobacteria bacterium]|nr:hypothetical protein [Deltaproteobacteria bacterium]
MNNKYLKIIPSIPARLAWGAALLVGLLALGGCGGGNEKDYFVVSSAGGTTPPITYEGAPSANSPFGKDPYVAAFNQTSSFTTMTGAVNQMGAQIRWIGLAHYHKNNGWGDIWEVDTPPPPFSIGTISGSIYEMHNGIPTAVVGCTSGGGSEWWSQGQRAILQNCGTLYFQVTRGSDQ